MKHPSTREIPNFKQVTVRNFWGLMIGVSLELGVWSLEL
jgi:hypothetical protein